MKWIFALDGAILNWRWNRKAGTTVVAMRRSVFVVGHRRRIGHTNRFIGISTWNEMTNLYIVVVVSTRGAGATIPIFTCAAIAVRADQTQQPRNFPANTSLLLFVPRDDTEKDIVWTKAFVSVFGQGVVRKP